MFARKGRMYRNGQRNQFPLRSLTVSEAEQWVCDSETAVTEVQNEQLQMSEPQTKARRGQPNPTDLIRGARCRAPSKREIKKGDGVIPLAPTASRSPLKAAVSTRARMIFVPLRFAAFCSAQLKYRKQQREKICGILHQNHPSPSLTSDHSLRYVGKRAAKPPVACVGGD